MITFKNLFNIFKFLLSNFVIIFVLILLIDNLLYSYPNLFPKHVVRHLSKEAQIKYYEKKLKSAHIHMIYDDYIYYYKPNLFIKEHNISSDSFGYKNPKQLIKDDISILLVGDSFVEAPEMGNSFREIMDPKTYSIGMGGQGVFHWKHQLKRFFTNYTKQHPNIIIFNYYEGNDINDSLKAIKAIKKTKSINSIYYGVSSSYKIENIDKKKGLFKEFDILYKSFFQKIIRNKYYKFKFNLKKYIKKMLQIHNPTAKIKKLNVFEVQFNESCVLTLDKEAHIYNHNFINKDYNFIKNEILEAKEMINKYSHKNIKIYLAYIPTVQSVYLLNKNFINQENYNLKKNNFDHKNHVDFLYNITQDLNIEFLNPTKKLQDIAKNESLHLCNKNDSHFNKSGYMHYAKSIKMLMNLR